MIEVYGRPNCRWCADVLELIKEQTDDPVIYFDLQRYDGMRDFFKSKFTSVPQVYIDGKLVGGYEDTASYFKKKNNDI